MMRKRLAVVLAGLMLVMSMTACSGSKKKVGIIQFADHGSLDNCRTGFVEGLAEEGFKDGENIEIQYQSGQADMNVTNQIAQTYASSGMSLVCGIATPAAQAAYAACLDKNIPVVFNAVSDPVAAKLAKSKTEAVDGISGISDELPVEAQLKLIRAVLPEAKKIGILYTTGEANSVSTIKTYKELAGKYGFEIVDKGIGKQAEVAQAADVLVGEVDCISNMTDNTVVSALAAVLEKANAKKIPVFGSEEEQVKNGCIASAGLDYVELGKMAGRMAAKILKGEDIKNLPYQTVENPVITVNEKAARDLGITIPEDVLKGANVQ